MTLTRRKFLQACGVGAAGVAMGIQPAVATASGLAPPIDRAGAANVPRARNREFSVLFDANRCIGCKLCQITCKKVNNLPPDNDVVSLSATTLTFVDFKNISSDLEKPDIKPVKRQCMHCEEPACVSVCPVGALFKKENGVVAYDPHKCIGCRYCMTACPFEIPKYNWDSAEPKINKCAAQCLDDGTRNQPACVQVCPVQALQYGDRNTLLALAHDRIDKNRDKYAGTIYGENEVGGTSWLYIGGVPFDKLGFRTDLPTTPLPQFTLNVMEKVPWVIGTAIAFLTGVSWWTHRPARKPLVEAPVPVRNE